MKYLILTQAKIETEGNNSKVFPLGKIAFDPNNIAMVHQVIDKFDYIIKGVTGIRTKQTEGFYISEDFNFVMAKLEEFNLIGD